MSSAGRLDSNGRPTRSFLREAATEVAGATLPALVKLVDASLLRLLPNGRFDRHALLHQFTRFGPIGQGARLV